MVLGSVKVSKQIKHSTCFLAFFNRLHLDSHSISILSRYRGSLSQSLRNRSVIRQASCTWLIQNLHNNYQQHATTYNSVCKRRRTHAAMLGVVGQQSCVPNAPINVKPQGGGGGRATHGKLTERAFPGVGILTFKRCPRVGNLMGPPSWKIERNWK